MEQYHEPDSVAREMAERLREQRAIMESNIMVLGLKRQHWNSMLDSTLADWQWRVLQRLQRGHDLQHDQDQADDAAT